MQTSVPGKGRTIVSWGLRVLLAAIFLLVGLSKLTGTGNTVEYFAAIGWGQWFRYVTGLLDITGVALLFVPRLASYGAIVLACSVGLAALLALTLLRGHPLWGSTQMVVVPLAFTCLAVVLAWLTRPSQHAP